MEELAIKKKNLAIINRTTKLTRFLVARVVRSDSDLFGKAEYTVDDPNFNKLIDHMITNKIESMCNNPTISRSMEVL